MITPELLQQTEARFAQREAIRHDKEAKIRSGAILAADTPERVRERLQHLAVRAMAVEGLGLPKPGETSSATTAILERILNKNDLMSINYLELGVRAARTVGRVHIRNGDGQVVGYGSGFLVSPRLIMTNNHVLENAESAGNSRIEFNFQEGPDGRLLQSFYVNFDSSAFFYTDKALDFSIVALKGDLSKITRFGWNGLSSAEGKLIVGEYVTIIQHPSGERKQIALRENQVIDVLDDFVHYKTDTSPGSSGSPVYNDQWEIVGLHHSGIPKKDAQGRILARDGSVWTTAMGDDNMMWIANEGVRISKILARVKGLSLSGSQAALRKQLLESEKGWVGDRSGSESTEEGTTESAGATRALSTPFQLTIAVSDGAKERSAAANGNGNGSSESAAANGTGAESAPVVPAVESQPDEFLAAWQKYEAASAPPRMTPVPQIPAQQTPAPATQPTFAQTAVEWLTATR